jgi:hypothetical protein
MNFKLLNLRNTRKFIASNSTPGPESPDRRSFIKTMGLGVISVNPIAETIKSVNYNPFEIRLKNNQLLIFRNERVVWEISDRFFEKGRNLSLISNEHSFQIKAGNLRIQNTGMEFSLLANIVKRQNDWMMEIRIPELSLQQEVNFVEWLDGVRTINSAHLFNLRLIDLNHQDGINLNGNFNIKISTSWKIELNGQDHAIVSLHGKAYATDNIVIQPFKKNSLSFAKSFDDNSVAITTSRFHGWENLMSQINFYETNRISFNQDTPELNILLNRSKDGTVCKALWVSEEKGNLYFWPDLRMEEKFVLDRYFYFSEYTDDSPSRFYLAGRLRSEGQWFSTSLGGFKFQNDNVLPVFESFGEDNKFLGHIFEPRLLAFHPIINDVTTVPAYFTPSQAVQINPWHAENWNGRETRENGEYTVDAPIRYSETENQDPQSRTKKNTRPQLNVSNIARLKISYEEIKFVPKRAIKITVLRPEDLLFLQFEFHNFKFYNKGQAPFLELDDPKSKGTMVVLFPSQHTLEQAFFESNELPTSNTTFRIPKINLTTSEPVLPVMQVRARKSRLVYELEAGHAGFPLMIDDLLDWSKFELRVHPRAWIKVINTIKPVTYPTLQKSELTRATLKDKYLERDVKLIDFGVRMAVKNRIKAQNELVYSDRNMENLLPVAKFESSGINFNIAELKNISMMVGPIPDTSTSIEAPALMYISPNQLNDFTHKIKLDIRNIEEQRVVSTQVNINLRVLDSLGAGKGEISELWHTRLGVKLKNGKTAVSGLDSLKTIRVLWADDALLKYNADAPKRDTPFLASLDGNNRHKLVHQTSDYSIPGFSPIPVPVRNLMLSSLGAYLNWHAFFNISSPVDNYLNISEWEHLATLGRDHYVKIVEKGYLFPFGHRAALVKVTERKFHQPTRSAVNRQRMYIVVLQKEVLYSRNDPDGKFIEFPFQEVRIETSATPNIDKPVGILSGTSAYNFYIKVAGQGYKFDIISTDKEGVEHRFRMPMLFLENIIARDYSQMEKVITNYNVKTDFTLTNFWNQKIAYANCMVDGDTTFETETINFGGQPYPAKGEGDIKFHPKVQVANVFIKQVEELTGNHKTAAITLEDDNNAGYVFAKVSGAVVDFSGGSDKSGGFLSPNMSISALSKLQGPVGGELADIKNLSFQAAKFFKALDGIQPPKIFGVIDIFSLLGDLNLGGSFNSMADTISSAKNAIDEAKNEILYLENQAKESIDGIDGMIKAEMKKITDNVKILLEAINGNIPRIPNLKSYFTEEAAYAEYKWQPELKANKIEVISGILNVNVDNRFTALTVLTKFERPFDSSKPAVLNTTARFENFGIDIVPLLEVNFNYLEFRSGSAQKTDVKVDINAKNPIVFKGALSFVNKLQSIIPNTGFSEDGPYIDLQPTGVTAGFNISIPSIEVGICNICNISLGAAITLPFTGAPLTLAFNFCTRENPFLLTVSCYGGGGYFLMVTTLHGIQSVEAAFEFGASLSLNIGVASGGVSVMGGFYFKVEKVHETISGVDQELTKVTLTGYLRINGHLSVLGMITVSVEFYLAFTAVFLGDKVEKLMGEATLKVKVEVLFFSKTVSMTVRRELKGADADPKFGEMIEADDWQMYCLAFAN